MHKMKVSYTFNAQTLLKWLYSVFRCFDICDVKYVKVNLFKKMEFLRNVSDFKILLILLEKHFPI